MEPARAAENVGTGGPTTKDTWTSPQPRLAEPSLVRSASRQAARRWSPGALPEPSPLGREGPPAATSNTFDAIVERVARSRISVVIAGETGVGKEVLAQRIHALSPRADKPLVAINCAAICDSLFESELFGHQRGAFTGAEQTKLGLIEAADGGSLFLDEVGDLSILSQVKLLRVLEARCVQRVGAVTARQIDVRFIAATNRDFDAEVAAGRFRADLLFRLEGIRLTLPPLRDRVSEIVPAARKFLEDYSRREGLPLPVISEAAARMLCANVWKGNFRELRNVMERAAVLCDGDRINPEHVEVAGSPSPELRLSVGPIHPGVPQSYRDRIIGALNDCAGNQTRAARLLGISRRTLVSHLEAHDIPRPRPRRALKVVAD
jgi:two-component system response regulator AtoC